MKKFARILSFITAAVVCAALFASCALEKSTDDKYFDYRLNADGTGYTVSASRENMPITVIIPETHEGLPVTGVAEQGFSGDNCVAIKEVVIKGAEVTVGAHAFRNLPNLRYVEFRNASTVTVGEYAFENCADLAELKLAEGLNAFTAGVFAFKLAAFTDLAIRANEVNIGEYAFSYCASLKSFTVAATTANVAETAVENCPNLSGIVYAN
ncbi:MAG: leucine-rich repeat protein [Clostridia bacterium]|nr:leucine-rich repeat protein [Clostridia bacterium]